MDSKYYDLRDRLLHAMTVAKRSVNDISHAAGLRDPAEIVRLAEEYKLVGPVEDFPDLGPLSSPDEKKGDEFLGRAKQVVFDWYQSNGYAYDSYTVYVVWFAYILGGWKALVSTSISDGRYHEVTFNANKSELYHDVYSKLENHTHEVETR